ncbi:kinase-like domain-containing protein [Chaetomium fimeti]|uniref:EKC/KEOPS complex subunit BUD32 n=1 Tax=Chaetomium fimeti TaxID=1854472 RepID=A0AAE0HNK6_9PEZI|nr:kinase-like domain-containing protein [Chaetomium fimeti]
MASQGPPPTQGDPAGVRFEAYPLAPVGTFLGIACITTGLRIYWRIRPTWRIGADDYTLVFALVLTIVWYGIDVAMYHYGRGIEGFMPDPWTMGPLIVADGVLWVWGLNVIRISAALLLLRLKDSLPWKLALWTVITVQACMLVVGTTMHLVMCQPISARWAPTPTAKCIPVPNFMIYGYVYSGLTIASDFTISILPITFIRTLRRPFYEKFLIGCLMTAGMGATGIAIARLLLIMGYLGKGGARINALQDFLWGMELTIGVLATSLPTLKAPVHGLLQSWGVLRSTSSSSDMSPDSFLDDLTNGPHVENQMRQWDSLSGIRLEYAPNHNLRLRLGENAVSFEQRLRWAIQVAETIKFIHDAGVIHGDLTCANIFLDANLNARVADFAGSSIDGSPLLIVVTESHEFPGPLLSTRADLFALGSVLYEITTGQPPYQGLKDTEIRARYLEHDFPDTTSLRAIGSVIEKCWHGKYPEARAVIEALKGTPPNSIQS